VKERKRERGGEIHKIYVEKQKDADYFSTKIITNTCYFEIAITTRSCELNLRQSSPAP
jgi:hypothetical protein